jgi:ATP-dependent Lon protease
MDDINKHQMLTRSKRKRENININSLEELSDEELSDEDENITMSVKKKICLDIDEHGNVKDLIDYDYFEPKSENYILESDDSMDDEEDETSLIGKLLSKYINKKLISENLDEKYYDVIKNYNPEMIDYFEDLEEEQKKEIIDIEKQITSINKNTIPLRFQILKSKISNEVKAFAIRKIEALKNLEPNSTEYYKIKGWVDGLLNIPFGNYQDLPININDNKEDITNYLVKANQTLNSAVHGHRKAKCQILQILAQWISNPRSKGNVFAIVGPMGNGKTTLVKEGIAKMINRPFQFISLGGATDSSFFDGHSYTYEGSQPGKIVDILKKSKCMNPVIYFDELDKVSETSKGEEIINLLIHMTDFSQNDHFIDKYYNDIPLDLSKSLFIFSLNDINKVNPILRDRMYMIHTNKLESEDKIIISKNYLIPSLCKEISIQDIIFDDDIIKYIIDKYSKEEGVRNLRRTYETILSKLNIVRITNTCKELELPFNIDNFILPFKVTIDVINKLVETNSFMDSEPPFGMYC